MAQATTVSIDDREHAHRLVNHLSAEQIHKAICALEDIIDGAVYVTEMPAEDEVIDAEENAAAAAGRKDLAEGNLVSMEELLAEYGMELSDLESYAKDGQSVRSADSSGAV